MCKIGFDVMEYVGKIGVVVVYCNGVGLMILVCIEFDVLLMEEKIGLFYVSYVYMKWCGEDVGVVYSCGYDVYMVLWVGIVKMLVLFKDCWYGMLVFVV